MSDTTPDPFEPDELDADLAAAAAVVDGTATEDDLARVAASERAAELVQQFLADRDDLVAAVDVDPATRESAIAAALAEFDRLAAPPADAVAAPVAPVVSLERRRRQYRLVMGVAAAVVSIVGIGAVLSDLGGDDRDQASTAIEAPAATESASAKSTPPVDGALDATATAGAADNESAPLAATADTMAAAATEAPADTAAPAASMAPAETESQDAPATTAPMAVIDTPEALRAWAATRPVPAPGDVRLATACVVDGQELLGDVVSLGVDAIAVRDAQTGALSTLDARTCAVLVTAP